jgi:hypothetical protein
MQSQEGSHLITRNLGSSTAGVVRKSANHYARLELGASPPDIILLDFAAGNTPETNGLYIR